MRRSLQMNVITACEKLKAFKLKLSLWSSRIELQKITLLICLLLTELQKTVFCKMSSMILLLI